MLMCYFVSCAAFVCRHFPMMQCAFWPLLSQPHGGARFVKRANFWLLKNSIETECGFSRSAKLLFSYIFVKNISRSSDTCFVTFRGQCGFSLSAKLLFSYIFVKNNYAVLGHMFRNIFRGPRTMLRLQRAAYKLELYGHRDSNISRSSDYVAPAAGRLQIGTLWTQGFKLSSVFEGMCSLGLVEVLDTPSVKYFAVLGLCCACGGPLINCNSMDTGTQT